MPVQILIVIITHGRFNYLKLCLDSLAQCLQRQSGDGKFSFSVLLGLNGISEPEWLGTHSLHSYPAFKTLKIENHLSPPSARNVLMKSTVSDYTLFFDDDVIVPESFLTDLCALIGEYPQAEVLGGPNLSPPQATLFEKASGLALASVWGTSVISSRYSPKQDSFFTRSELPFALCNLCIKNTNKELFHKELKYGEETDLLQRLFKKSDCLGYYSSKLFVWHFRRPDWRSFMIQMFKYGLGRGLTLKDATLGRNLQFLVLIALYLIGGMIILSSLPLLICVLLFVFLFSLLAAPKPLNLALWFYFAISLMFIYALYPLGIIAGVIRRCFPAKQERS